MSGVQINLVAFMVVALITTVSGITVVVSLLRRGRNTRYQTVILDDSSVRTLPSALKRPPPAIVVPPPRIVRKTKQVPQIVSRPKPSIVQPAANVPIQFIIDAVGQE